MKTGGFLGILICTGFLGACLYSYLDLQNQITKLRLRIPDLVKEVSRIEEENIQFFYQIKYLESPENLMQLVQHNEFSHFTFPQKHQVLTLTQKVPLQGVEKEQVIEHKTYSNITFATKAP